MCKGHVLAKRCGFRTRPPGLREITLALVLTVHYIPGIYWTTIRLTSALENVPPVGYPKIIQYGHTSLRNARARVMELGIVRIISMVSAIAS